jgi:hypothetical protein
MVDALDIRDGVLYCGECGEAMTADPSWIQETSVGFVSLQPWHVHDDNCKTLVYVCAHKHKRIVSIRRRCDKCDWLGIDSCSCHHGTKVDEWPSFNGVAGAISTLRVNGGRVTTKAEGRI